MSYLSLMAQVSALSGVSELVHLAFQQAALALQATCPGQLGLLSLTLQLDSSLQQRHGPFFLLQTSLCSLKTHLTVACKTKLPDFHRADDDQSDIGVSTVLSWLMNAFMCYRLLFWTRKGSLL